MISKEVHTITIEIVNAQKKSTAETNHLSQRLAELNVQHSEDVDPPYDECYCGEDASASPGTSDMIACDNIVSH